jgi:hypothetical protein
MPSPGYVLVYVLSGTIRASACDPPRLMAREELVGARIESSAHSGAANVAYVQMQERTQ